MTDACDLIGLDLESLIPCQAFDEEEDPIDLQNVIAPFAPEHAWTEIPSSTGANPFTLNLQLVPGQSLPSTLSQVDFLFFGYYAQTLTADLSMSPLDEWREIAAGFETKITRIAWTSDLFYYQITVRIKDETTDSNSLNESTSRTSISNRREEESVSEGEEILFNIDILSPDGTVIKTTSFSLTNSVGDSHSYGYSTNNEVDSLRYTITLPSDSYIIPLSLYDIPIVQQ